MGCVQVSIDVVGELLLSLGSKRGGVHSVCSLDRLCDCQQLRAISIGWEHIHSCVASETCRGGVTIGSAILAKLPPCAHMYSH